MDHSEFFPARGGKGKMYRSYNKFDKSVNEINLNLVGTDNIKNNQKTKLIARKIVPMCFWTSKNYFLFLGY